MNRLDEIHLHNGKNGLIDLVQNKDGKQIRVTVCDENNIGVYTIWINVPNDTTLDLNDFPHEEG